MRFDLTRDTPDLFHAMLGVDDAIVSAATAALGSAGLVQLILLRTSVMNRCEYCIGYHSRLALEAGVTEGQLQTHSAMDAIESPSRRDELLFQLSELLTRKASDEQIDRNLEAFQAIGSAAEWRAAVWLISACNLWNRLLLASGTKFESKQ